MKRRPLFFTIIISLLTVTMVASAGGQERKTGHAPTLPAEAVIVPTLGNDHQFNLDYTVAHLMALLDAISPDAILISDYTEWLRRDCPWSAGNPETHVALRYARERSLPIFGTSATPSHTYEADAKFAKEYREKYPDAQSVHNGFRERLDLTTAGIARDYSFTGESRGPQVLVTRIFRSKLAEWTQQQRDAVMTRSKQIADEVERLTANNDPHRRWAIVIWWGHAPFVEDALRERRTVRVVPINNYLPLKPEAVEKRLDYKNTAWILAGILDEWYGMWAPQTFPGERIAALLARLKRLSPSDPVTEFLQARWLMQNRDYKALNRSSNVWSTPQETRNFHFLSTGNGFDHRGVRYVIKQG